MTPFFVVFKRNCRKMYSDVDMETETISKKYAVEFLLSIEVAVTDSFSYTIATFTCRDTDQFDKPILKGEKKNKLLTKIQLHDNRK